MAVKRKAGRASKAGHKSKSTAAKAPKAKARKTARVAKKPAAKKTPKRKPKQESAIERAEATVAKIARKIVPKAREAIASVTKTISGKK